MAKKKLEIAGTWLSERQAAERIGLSRYRLRQLAEDGVVRVRKERVPKSLYRAEDLDEALESTYGQA